SYIYIYGDTDVEKHMEMLDREYLSKYEKTEVCSDIKELTEPFSTYECGKYSVSAGEKKENDSIFSLNYVTGKSTDLLQSISMDILTYILFDTNASPVKKALIESGICEEAEGWHDNTTYQCVLSIIAKNCKTEDKDKFVAVVKESLEKAAEGLDKKLILSVLNYWEFMLREADFGYRPKGLAYGMSMMKGYLHGQDAAECLKTWKFFDIMRDGIDKGYFENLIKERILSNDFRSFVMIEAEEGLQAENDKKDSEKLKAIKESLTEEELDNIIEETKTLKEYQSQADSEEIISQIPLLSADEIDKEKEYDKAEEIDGKLYFKADTNGIVYAKAVFKADCLEKEELCYVGLIEEIAGKIDTENFDYSSLPSEINMYTGGIEAECIAYSPDEKRLVPAIAINGKALERNLGKLFELLGEVVMGMKYDCKDSMLKIIKETKGYLERKFEDSGHSVSSVRALACCKNGSAFMDMTSGIAFYDFILWAEENIDEVCEKAAEAASKIFTKENLIFAYCCEEKAEKEVSSMADEFKEKLASAQYEEKNYNLIAEIKKQGITNSSKVVYNSIAANFKKFGFEYSGKMKVIKNIVNTEYLWNEVRVRGGAYGCGCNILRNGSIYTYSYRDPNVKETYDAYKNIGEFLRNAVISPREMTKYILGAINEMDKPKSFQTRFDVAVSEHLNSITKEKKQKEREELLSIKPEDVAPFGEIFDKAFDAQIKVTLGNEKAINTSAELFDDIRGMKKR
ncbi:MAG: insulinase family protein, partial [Firmicutes bacterium]|nr:insulinase family protein [Bacillota bacterium]